MVEIIKMYLFLVLHILTFQCQFIRFLTVGIHVILILLFLLLRHSSNLAMTVPFRTTLILTLAPFSEDDFTSRSLNATYENKEIKNMIEMYVNRVF